MSREIKPERGAYSSARVRDFAAAIQSKLYGRKPGKPASKRVIDVTPIRATETAPRPESPIRRLTSRLRSLLPRF